MQLVLYIQLENTNISSQIQYNYSVMHDRQYSLLDQVILRIDEGLGTFNGAASGAPRRPSPAGTVEDLPLNDAERRLSEGLMRVNHAGEVSAQALYQGQAITARNPGIASTLKQSAEEEVDHLAWCETRIRELGGHTSYLNPLWYLGSFTMGVVAGLAGDRWNLGFVAETEKQVVEHLQDHLQRLPANDLKSQAILNQMAIDEAHHGNIALDIGGSELPAAIKTAMRFCSSVMTGTAYWV